MALYIVGTPIGNLEDITLRAIRTLKEVNFILAEDTRETAKLLRKYDIATPLVSYRDQNHNRIITKVFEKLDLGLNLALVSDAGTPTISDPGYKLVHEVKMKGYEVIPIPGPSAVITALSASGIPTDKFIFVGFLPKSDSKREEILKKYMTDDSTIVIYEAPTRLIELLEMIANIDGKRNVSIANDLTKMMEKIEFGQVELLLKNWKDLLSSGRKIKGEFVISISKEN